VDLKLGLELADPALGRGQLLALKGRQPGDEPPVNLLLAAPGVDRLIADPEIAGNIGDFAPGLDEVNDAAPELGRVTPSSPWLPPTRDSSMTSSYQTPRKAGHTIWANWTALDLDYRAREGLRLRWV